MKTNVKSSSPVGVGYIRTPLFASLLLASVVGLEFGVLFFKAGSIPFVHDELLTFHVSALQPFSRLWTALLAGADGLPPGYYIIVRFARMLPGDPRLTLRLPSILGYILTLLGVYWFAGRRLRPVASLTATLLISLSPFREYALLARSYSLLVGFLAISAALWQRIDEKRLMTPLLALFLCLAVCCHHLAVVAILIFGMAELTWSLLSRRIRWGVWAACLSATVPFLVGFPLILHFREMFGQSFYSRPSWSTAVSTYGGYWGLDAHFALVLILFFGIAVGDKLSGMLRTPIEKSPKGDFSPPEIILVGGFLLYPAFLVVLAKLSGGGYGARYGWPAILGLVLGSMYLFRAMWRSYGHILGALVIAFAIQACNDVITLAKAGSTRMGERWTALAKVSRGEPDIPVVIDSMGGYLEAFQYAPPEMHDRLVQVIDESIAMRLDGTDTNVKAQRVRAQFIPLRVVEVAAFEPAHPRFILYSSGGHDWFTQYLVEKGYHLALLSTNGTASVYMVQR